LSKSATHSIEIENVIVADYCCDIDSRLSKKREGLIDIETIIAFAVWERGADDFKGAHSDTEIEHVLEDQLGERGGGGSGEEENVVHLGKIRERGVRGRERNGIDMGLESGCSGGSSGEENGWEDAGGGGSDATEQ
jgi:hypothetical protein